MIIYEKIRHESKRDTTVLTINADAACVNKEKRMKNIFIFEILVYCFKPSQSSTKGLEAPQYYIYHIIFENLNTTTPK